MLCRKRTRVVEHDRVVEHEQIVDAATEVLQIEGLLAIDRKRPATALNVPEQQLEVDAGAVAAEAYRRLGAAELAEVKRRILADPSPAEQMRRLLNWLATPPEDSDAVRLEAWALTRSNPAMRSAVQQGEAGWHALVAAVIRRGARSGDFPQADADEIAAHVLSLMDGINAYQLIGYRSDLDRMRLLTRVVQAELGLVWGAELTAALA